MRNPEILTLISALGANLMPDKSIRVKGQLCPWVMGPLAASSRAPRAHPCKILGFSRMRDPEAPLALPTPTRPPAFFSTEPPVCAPSCPNQSATFMKSLPRWMRLRHGVITPKIFLLCSIHFMPFEIRIYQVWRTYPVHVYICSLFFVNILAQVDHWQAGHFNFQSGKHCTTSRCLAGRGLPGRTRHSLSKVQVSQTAALQRSAKFRQLTGSLNIAPPPKPTTLVSVAATLHHLPPQQWSGNNYKLTVMYTSQGLLLR